MVPIACILKNWCKPGFLVLQELGGGYRTAYSIAELTKHNPADLVEAYAKNLNEGFLKWLDSQECLSRKPEYRWQHGDIPPIWFDEHGSTLSSPDYLIDPPKDTRQVSDYLSYGDDGPVRCPRRTAKKKVR